MSQLTVEQAKLFEEYKRRQEHIVNTYQAGEIDGWNQKSFHESTADIRLLFGGNQSGKSHTNAYEIVCWLTGDHPYRKVPDPPNVVWAISTEYVTLQSGIYRHIKNMLPDWQIAYIGPKIPQQQLPTFIELKNGSMVQFKSAKGDDSARQKFQAEAVDLISIDEEIASGIWDELQSRTIITAGQFIISATLVESFEWITDLEDLARSDKIGDYHLTRLDTRKNPYADKKRVDKLEDSWSLEERNVRLSGLSRRASGLVYNRWDEERNVVDSFPIPDNWPRWCCIDPGFRTIAVLWVAVGPDQKAYAYRELYLQNEALWAAAKEIKEVEGYILNESLSESFGHYVWEPGNRPEKMVCRLVDDKIGSHLVTGEEGVHGQLYSRYGISATPAEKSVQAGIEDVRWWIENGFHVFRSLVNFISERKTYVLKPPKSRKSSDEPPDKPVKKKDHLMDCWRYIARQQPRWEDRLLVQEPPKESIYTDAAYAKRREKRADQGYYHETVGEW